MVPRNSTLLRGVKLKTKPVRWDSTLLELQSNFGRKPLNFQGVCPRNGTTVLKGLRTKLRSCEKRVFFLHTCNSLGFTIPLFGALFFFSCTPGYAYIYRSTRYLNIFIVLPKLGQVVNTVPHWDVLFFYGLEWDVGCVLLNRTHVFVWQITQKKHGKKIDIYMYAT